MEGVLTVEFSTTVLIEDQSTFGGTLEGIVEDPEGNIIENAVLKIMS